MAFTAPDGRTQTSLADINITPLVDVVLVLLIIFMVTAPVLQSGIEVAVPKTRTVKEVTQQRLVITIDKAQRVFVGDQAVNINDIPSLLRQKASRHLRRVRIALPAKRRRPRHRPPRSSQPRGSPCRRSRSRSRLRPNSTLRRCSPNFFHLASSGRFLNASKSADEVSTLLA